MHPLQEILKDVNGNTIISVDMVTTPALLGGKDNPHKGHIRKVSIGNNVMVFTNQKSNGYSNMVQRRLVAEGKDPKAFELKPRKWGERIEGTPFVEHNGEIYVEMIFLRAGETSYRLGERPIAAEDIIGLNERGERSEQGGLDNKVVIRSVKCDNIKRIAVDKKTYIL